MANRGKDEGNLNEINRVKYLNRNVHNEKLSEYVNEFGQVYFVKVSTKQYSTLASKKVYTRADSFAIKTNDTRMNSVLKENDFLLDENLLKEHKIDFTPIPFSGISMKLEDSNYQILKMTPNSFEKLFGNRILGAAASIFVKKEEELCHNKNVIEGWGCTMTKFLEYFNITEEELFNSLEKCKEIRDCAEKEIISRIKTDKELQQKIFNGTGLYEEPYTAHWFMEGENLSKLTTLPFKLTTGSGRHKGNYTLVLKKE